MSKTEQLAKRRSKVNKLMYIALQENKHHKAAQARYLLHLIDSKLFTINSFYCENKYK